MRLGRSHASPGRQARYVLLSNTVECTLTFCGEHRRDDVIDVCFCGTQSPIGRRTNAPLLPCISWTGARERLGMAFGRTCGVKHQPGVRASEIACTQHASKFAASTSVTVSGSPHNTAVTVRRSNCSDPRLEPCNRCARALDQAACTATSGRHTRTDIFSDLVRPVWTLRWFVCPEYPEYSP